jgi:hypothetical protein
MRQAPLMTNRLCSFILIILFIPEPCDPDELNLQTAESVIIGAVAGPA